MLTLTLIQKIVVWTIPLLLAITLHEAAHAWVASRCGDTTAKMLGRLSINPIRHIDLIGTILVPLCTAVLSHFQFIFGWAKPVPIDWTKLHKPRRDMILVAAAGPLSNIIMAFLWLVILKIVILYKPETSGSLFLVLLFWAAQAGALLNLILAFINLFPIPPLDGGRIVAGLLPPRQAAYYLKIAPFGILILIALLFTGVLSGLTDLVLSWLFGILTQVIDFLIRY